MALPVPPAALRDFGLDPEDRLSLEVAGRYRSFYVFRISMPDRLQPEKIRQLAGALYRHNPARRALLSFEAPGDERLVLATWGLGPGPLRLAKLWIDRTAPRPSEIDILAGLAVNRAATASDLALAQLQALDREAVTRRFFDEFRQSRDELAHRLIGLPRSARQERLELALLLLSRLLFLYFIQRKGWLAGDTAFLRHLYQSACRDGTPFFRRRLKHLFFGALNRPPARRSGAAQQLGELPYLNGGLFERHALEKKYRKLDVPDDAFLPVFRDLLDKYQFTLREDQPGDQDVAIDPEMLGKVFEGLMSAPQRGSSGTFFTPRPLVDRLVDGALTAHLTEALGCEVGTLEAILRGTTLELEESLRTRLLNHVRCIRVLDPAVGSGAFLLAALQRLELLYDALEGPPADAFARFERRQQIIQHNLFGIDINDSAVRLCELRLWLALVVDLETESISQVPPLPNLDVNIRQGDTLVDPVDFIVHLADLDFGRLSARWRRELSSLASRRDRYFRATGGNKRTLQRRLRLAERDLAAGFLGDLAAQVEARRRDLRSQARSRDLFGNRSGLSQKQKRLAATLKHRQTEIRRLLRKVRDAAELPFFSFQVHFPHPGQASPRFHVVLGNPPWVRAHLWAGTRRHLKQRYKVLREAGWVRGSRWAGAGRGFGAQLDLSALFLERSLELLADDGALGFLIPATLVRGLAAGALRRRLLVDTRIHYLEDRSLGTTRSFAATTYPLALVLTRGKATPGHRLTLALHDRRGGFETFALSQTRLSLLSEDPEAPWVLAPPTVRDSLDKMQASAPPLGAQPGRRPRRGIVTGNNALFVGEVIDPERPYGKALLKLADREVEVERTCLRPALRGEDLAPWRFRTSRALVWTHDDKGGYVLPALPESTATYLRAYRRELTARIDLRPGQLYWTLFRLDPAKWHLRVAWRDIAIEPAAVVVPARVPFLASQTPVISLNTVYQIPAESEDDAHLMAAILNSTIARAFLKAIAERASGGHFRFLGWTVALLPFPENPDPAVRLRCVRLSRAAHAAASLSHTDQRILDEEVARLFGLTPKELSALRRFDSRLTTPAHR